MMTNISLSRKCFNIFCRTFAYYIPLFQYSALSLNNIAHRQFKQCSLIKIKLCFKSAYIFNVITVIYFVKMLLKFYILLDICISLSENI